jgi:thiazole tautomerase (transcriptional regulator TenI)
MKLIAITDDTHSVNELASIISHIKDSIDYVHIREKSKTAQQILSLMALLEEGGVPKKKIVMHDRLDIALLAKIPNVHLPSHGLPVRRVRDTFPGLRIGRSVHSVEEAQQAEQDGAHYVLYGHCFETNSKKGMAPNGIHPIIEMKQRLAIPVFAIGGITPERVSTLQQIQTDGIAVMSGIFSSTQPLASAREFLKKGVRERL